jgi:ABC-type polysaccharide/polyol phosphate transport system ATPase subunit
MTASIELRGVSKRYNKLQDDATLLKSILPFRKTAGDELWALRGLDLRVEAGEIVGVIGHNGAGKTTLLRLLAGVTNPTMGRVRITGRIAPLISLGVGFHNEMTGRENVLVNGMLLGLSARQVAERFESIVEFSEMAQFIDTPVKFYSSGMILRLAFAVVVHIDPTILLVDEILAVGDASFQLKCFDRLRAFQEQGAAILLVSHQLFRVRQLCSRAVLLRHGELEHDGDVETAIELYQASGADDAETIARRAGSIEVVNRRLVGATGEKNNVEYDQPVELHLALRFKRRVEDPQIVAGIMTDERQLVGFNITQRGEVWRTFEPGDECHLRVAFRARLAGGQYILSLSIRERDTGRVLIREHGPQITVAQRDGVDGVADVLPELAVTRI